MNTAIRHAGIGVDQLKQIDIAGAERKRGSFFQGRLNAHVVGGLNHVLNADFLSELHGNRVDATGKSGAKRNLSVAETTIRVVRLPNRRLVLLLVEDFHANIFVFPTI